MSELTDFVEDLRERLVELRHGMLSPPTPAEMLDAVVESIDQALMTTKGKNLKA